MTSSYKWELNDSTGAAAQWYTTTETIAQKAVLEEQAATKANQAKAAAQKTVKVFAAAALGATLHREFGRQMQTKRHETEAGPAALTKGSIRTRDAALQSVSR